MDEQPWPEVETCVSNLEAGLAELRVMQKSIERHTRQQLAAGTMKENLAILFDRFSERIGRACYSQMVQARLPSKLADARRTTDELMNNPDLLTKMQTEVMRRHNNLSPEAAMAQVRLRLDELAQLLHHVEPLADAIDRRTAEFARRSQARFSYLQETTSENRGILQDFFETLNQHFAGHRLAEIDEEKLQLPALKLHELRLLGGMESLFVPRLRRAAGEIEPIEDSDDSSQERALSQIESSLRDSLTVNRANRFVQALPGESGARISSEVLLRDCVNSDQDIADLIACLLHARSGDARYRVESTKEATQADQAEFDQKLQYRIERFTLVKK